ncbi:MAG: DNA-binding protein [Butyricicoccus sp.]|nr:DNA-binding protein [Butyricicoccus sp.]
MSRYYLGIDTSNYRTSAALFDAESGEWQNSGRLLEVPEGSLGLRQSDALFQHTLHLHEMIAGLPAGVEIHAVCVSTRPRAVEGSYMPCFLAGVNVARSIAHVLGVPLYECSHQQGHLAAAACSAGALHLLDEAFYAWHLSGGTTELLRVTPGEFGLCHAECIGGTSDLAAGQIVDRCGVLLGLPFPAGAALEELAVQSNAGDFFRPKVKESSFSLSGVENKFKKMYDDGAAPADIASFTLKTILSAVETATAQAIKSDLLPVLCAGGVMSNRMLQKRMSDRFGARFAEPVLSGDNAVGAAILAALQNGEKL